MRPPLPSDARPGSSPLTPAFSVHYSNGRGARALLAQPLPVCGMIGYGAGRPAYLPAGLPYVAAPLLPAEGDPAFEIWTTAAPTRARQIGPVAGACNDDVAFGAIELAESAAPSLEAAAEAAYLRIFDFLSATGHAAPIRFWNYLTSITEDDRGLERYRRFNIGRAQAFAGRLAQAVPPAASCVGGQQRPGRCASVIYFLAARAPAMPIENPRQVSAYDYPLIYGPRSPSFSRASIYTQRGMAAMFVSGTASIVGHESRHRDDLAGQLAETLRNISALIEAAQPAAASPRAAQWALKIYLHNPADRSVVDRAVQAMFGNTCQRLYLRADICRPDLLIEIEAFRNFQPIAA